MTVVADVFSAFLAIVFGGAAIAKLVRQKQHVQTAAKLRIPWQRYRWISVPEAAAVAGLLIGFAQASFGAAAGSGLVVLMAGALFFRLRVHDSASFLLGDAALLGVAAATAVLRISAG